MDEWRPGLFRVRADFPNPDGDKRRVHDFWRVPVWKCGTRILVEPDPDLGGALVVRPPRGPARVTVSRFPSIQLSLARLLSVLDPVPESLETILATTHCSAATVLGRLVNAGVVSMTDVERACRLTEISRGTNPGAP